MAACVTMTHLPVRFEANAGQWPERIRFVGRGARGATLLLTDDGMTFVLHDGQG
jgi:hypothetical protein